MSDSQTRIMSDGQSVTPEHSAPAAENYRVWAADNQVYGPVPLEILSEWVSDGRVGPEDWVYLEARREWRAARRIEGLSGLFPPGEDTMFLMKQASEPDGVTPDELRQVSALRGITKKGLVQLIKYGRVIHAQPGELVLRRNEPGDCLLFVLSGSVRVRILVGQDDKTLSQVKAGQVLGEIAMFTQSARSADAVAEEPSRLFRLDAQALHEMMEHCPETAARMLYAISCTLARHVFEDNRRFQSEVVSQFLWR